MPAAEPEGECEIPPGTVVFCNSTGEMSVVDTEGRSVGLYCPGDTPFLLYGFISHLLSSHAAAMPSLFGNTSTLAERSRFATCRRRWFNSAAVWASYLHPPVQFEEGGDCPLIAACRAGERLQLKGELGCG